MEEKGTVICHSKVIYKRIFILCILCSKKHVYFMQKYSKIKNSYDRLF